MIRIELLDLDTCLFCKSFQSRIGCIYKMRRLNINLIIFARTRKYCSRFVGDANSFLTRSNTKKPDANVNNQRELVDRVISEDDEYRTMFPRNVKKWPQFRERFNAFSFPSPVQFLTHRLKMSSPTRQVSVRRLPPLPNQITNRATLKESSVYLNSNDGLNNTASLINSASLDLKPKPSKGKQVLFSFIIKLS